MKYCTHCGRKLPASGECPYCSNRYFGRRNQPMVRAVLDGGKSYLTLALACMWTVSILCLLVFSVLTANPLIVVALPGIPAIVGLWLVFGAEGPAQRTGFGLVAGSLMAMSLLTLIALTALSLLSLAAIFLCTAAQSYENATSSLLILTIALLFCLPFLEVYLHKLRRVALTSRSVLLRSRSTVEVSPLAIVLSLLGAAGGFYAAFHLETADARLGIIRETLDGIIPNVFSVMLTFLSGISWAGMMIPLLLLGMSLLLTGIVLIRYQVRLHGAKKEIRGQADAREAVEVPAASSETDGTPQATES